MSNVVPGDEAPPPQVTPESASPNTHMHGKMARTPANRLRFFMILLPTLHEPLRARQFSCDVLEWCVPGLYFTKMALLETR
jgi:hypothetical protein